MATIKAHTLSGFMELLPAPQTQMERLMEVLRSSYGVYGFTPLDTPIIEASDVLLAKGGGETEKQIYRFTKGDSDLALRFDLTDVVLNLMVHRFVVHDDLRKGASQRIPDNGVGPVHLAHQLSRSGILANILQGLLPFVQQGADILFDIAVLKRRAVPELVRGDRLTDEHAHAADSFESAACGKL